MTSLSAHMQAITKLASGKAGPEILAPLLENQQDPGPRALVYRNSGQKAVRDALASNYPSLNRVMGDEFFDRMARSFGDQYPPTERSLVGYGKALPGFITDAKNEHSLPWLADMARLDLAWLEAHLAAAAPEFIAEDFAALAVDPDTLMETKLTVNPSLRLVTSRWRLHQMWSELRMGKIIEESHKLEQAAEAVLIWRLDNKVRHRVLTEAEFGFISFISEGKILGEAAKAALAIEAELDVGALLAASVSAGLFAQQSTIKGLNV